MEMTGERLIPAPRAAVWAALNDPDVLRQCIPGCESLEKTGENGFEAKSRIKIGPVKAAFSGKVTLSDITPPESYTISGEGSGGAAGFASGSARVTLTEQEGGTLLAYSVQAAVGGKLAQIGGRLIDATAKKMADDFFTRFAELALPADAADSAPGAAAAPAATGEIAETGGPRRGVPPLLWVGAVAVAALGLAIAFS